MCVFSYVWSRDKDGGYIIPSAIDENPMLHANFMSLCFIEPELWPLEVLHCGKFLLLWPWSWPWRWPSYKNLTHITLRYTGCANMNFLPTSRLSKVIVWHERQTDRQTRPNLYSTPLRGWSVTTICTHLSHYKIATSCPLVITTSTKEVM